MADTTTSISFDKMEEEFAYSMGIQAYTFGLPLTIGERERRIRLNSAARQSMIGIAPVCKNITYFVVDNLIGEKQIFFWQLM